MLGGNLSMKRIIVCDDEPHIVEGVRFLLRSSDRQIVVARSGMEALALIEEQMPDLLILDIMMPEMSGLEVLGTLRAAAATQKLPIIILTAKGEERDRVRGLDAGADDYIVKPFSAQEMLARVRAVLRRAERTMDEAFHQPIFNHHELEIDLPRAMVTVAGEKVSLTATEYRLLQTFAASIGQVISSDDLLSLVWGPEYQDDKEILWVCLSRLRQKIEPDAAEPKFIVGVRGVGYRFDG